MTNEEILKLTDALCTAPAETDAAVWADKLFTLIEAAVRTLDCELSAVDRLREPIELRLEKSADFPLPEALAPAAAFLAAYLASGNAACKAGYERALERCRAAIPADITPVVERYRF